MVKISWEAAHRMLVGTKKPVSPEEMHQLERRCPTCHAAVGRRCQGLNEHGIRVEVPYPHRTRTMEGIIELPARDGQCPVTWQKYTEVGLHRCHHDAGHSDGAGYSHRDHECRCLDHFTWAQSVGMSE
jgi:hypothetical protein